MKVFKEVQRFTQPWLLILLGISTLVPSVILFQAYFNEEVSLFRLLGLLALLVLATGSIFFFKLSTRIDELGIHYQFFPLHRKKRLIAWSSIASAELRTYDAIGEYGGWGLKSGALWNTKGGLAVNVSGSLGIQLVLNTGQKILIGTQQQEAVKQVLKNYIKDSKE